MTKAPAPTANAKADEVWVVFERNDRGDDIVAVCQSNEDAIDLKKSSEQYRYVQTSPFFRTWETLTRGEVKRWIQNFPLNSVFSDTDGSLRGALALKEQLAHNIQALEASSTATAAASLKASVKHAFQAGHFDEKTHLRMIHQDYIDRKVAELSAEIDSALTAEQTDEGKE